MGWGVTKTPHTTCNDGAGAEVGGKKKEERKLGHYIPSRAFSKNKLSSVACHKESDSDSGKKEVGRRLKGESGKKIPHQKGYFIYLFKGRLSQEKKRTCGQGGCWGRPGVYGERRKGERSQ